MGDTGGTRLTKSVGTQQLSSQGSNQGAIQRSTQLIVALDFATAAEARQLVERLRGLPVLFKVGLELFSAEGPGFVRELVKGGYRVFVDLKLHDIPNTVAKAVESVGRLGAEMLTVHLGGGAKMLEAAAKAAPASLRILGVSVLTSFSEDEWARTAGALSGNSLGGSSAGASAPVGNSGLVGRSVQSLIELSEGTGVRSYVCSPHEIGPLKAQNSSRFLVVPGIRPSGAEKGDQARIMTPTEAAKLGADAIVVGRPITQAVDPRAATIQVLAELQDAQ